jgi:hypothetical protein
LQFCFFRAVGCAIVIKGVGFGLVGRIFGRC